MNNKLFGNKNRKKSQFISDINITPFVDVLLVLLIIFMIAAPMLNGAVEVDLPQGDASKEIKKKDTPLMVSINKKGDVIVGDSKTEFDKLKEKLIEVSKNNLNQKIYIRGDRSVDYGLIMKVIKKINESGFSKVILVTNTSSQN